MPSLIAWVNLSLKLKMRISFLTKGTYPSRSIKSANAKMIACYLMMKISYT